jgi:hypothetical protein
LPIIVAIASLPTAKTSPDDLAAAKIAYASKLKITYKRNPDGSVMLKSIRGITEKDFKKLSDGELEAMCLYRESIGRSTKYWEITNDDLVGKAIAEPEIQEIGYSINQKDGSIATRTLKGISVAKIKKLSAEELNVIGIKKKSIDGTDKFFPIKAKTIV